MGSSVVEVLQPAVPGWVSVEGPTNATSGSVKTTEGAAAFVGRAGHSGSTAPDRRRSSPAARATIAFSGGPGLVFALVGQLRLAGRIAHRVQPAARPRRRPGRWSVHAGRCFGSSSQPLEAEPGQGRMSAAGDQQLGSRDGVRRPRLPVRPPQSAKGWTPAVVRVRTGGGGAQADSAPRRVRKPAPPAPPGAGSGNFASKSAAGHQGDLGAQPGVGRGPTREPETPPPSTSRLSGTSRAEVASRVPQKSIPSRPSTWRHRRGGSGGQHDGVARGDARLRHRPRP